LLLCARSELFNQHRLMKCVSNRRRCSTCFPIEKGSRNSDEQILPPGSLKRIELQEMINPRYKSMCNCRLYCLIDSWFKPVWFVIVWCWQHMFCCVLCVSELFLMIIEQDTVTYVFKVKAYYESGNKDTKTKQLLIKNDDCIITPEHKEAHEHFKKLATPSSSFLFFVLFLLLFVQLKWNCWLTNLLNVLWLIVFDVDIVQINLQVGHWVLWNFMRNQIPFTHTTLFPSQIAKILEYHLHFLFSFSSLCIDLLFMIEKSHIAMFLFACDQSDEIFSKWSHVLAC